MEANGGCLSEERRFELAKAAFAHTAHYDTAIASYLANVDSVRSRAIHRPSTEDDFQETLTLHFKKERTLRYGENPHQRAAFYKTETNPGACAAWANQLSGQPLSFNNLLDVEAALEIVKDFEGSRLCDYQT